METEKKHLRLNEVETAVKESSEGAPSFAELFAASDQNKEEDDE